jgi:cytochrome b561
VTKPPRSQRWNGLVVALHWLSALIILELLAHGAIMVHATLSAAAAFDLYQLHKSLGFVVLALTAARLLARAASKAPAARGPLWERRLAAFVQAALYALTILTVFAGWMLVSASPLPIPTRFFDLFVIPNVGKPDASLFAAATLAHRLAAYAIAGLVALHVAGALKHHVVDQDDVLARMTPRRPAPTPGRPDF